VIDGGALEHAELQRQPGRRLLQREGEMVELVGAEQRVRHALGDEIGGGRRGAALQLVA
jgi:hypothetical protein